MLVGQAHDLAILCVSIYDDSVTMKGGELLWRIRCPYSGATVPTEAEPSLAVTYALGV